MSKKDGYKNISASNTSRVLNNSNIDAKSELVNENDKLYENRPEAKNLIKPITNHKPMDINIKSVHLNTKSIVLQNPHMQMYNSFTNYSVCPFCKFSGAMNITYKTSQKQKLCCFGMALTGIYAICCWVPFLVKDCSLQVYSCPNCGEELQTLAANKI